MQIRLSPSRTQCEHLLKLALNRLGLNKYETILLYQWPKFTSGFFAFIVVDELLMSVNANMQIKPANCSVDGYIAYLNIA